ncbi:U6 snRNA phosphodiesterase [Psilocybe cubensis]|uniref:U6 snRNA phosphodiesterase n=2 Tax=Psilocybe cubensis TaxID=181762 RepID=A0A8H7XTC1_PSICU|nr:U6 snRNA phosphodiesterase [Psilocybe cubensis]KAH9480557.1 U6 snRNA phosphodiesterase [Psilocybe cubensis]
MKRALSALVAYASSDEESPCVVQPKGTCPDPPPKKRKKLPPPSSTITIPSPVDNPALHQGRIRTTPHVEGQFAAHVYVSLPLGRNSMLYKVVQAILYDAKKAIPALHEIWTSQQRPELHISLSRPIFLRAHQREDLKRAVKKVANRHRAFTVSFAILSELINDEKTRTFLTMEVGAGHHELRSLTDAIAPTLEAIRQQTYYVKPRFHASIAWALLCSSDHAEGHRAIPSVSNVSSFPETNASLNEDFPSIKCLPPETVITLNERYASQISSPNVGAFEANAVTLKIGKDISTWTLIGP